jgi:Uma2 family endonuclease
LTAIAERIVEPTRRARYDSGSAGRDPGEARALESPKRYTIDEIERLPEDETFELLRGEPLPMSPVSLAHLVMTAVLIEALRSFVRQRRLGIVGGEAGFVLPTEPEVLLAPDIAFVRRDRLPPRSAWDGFPRLAPDLAVEVVSPRETASEVNDKTLSYLDAGVRLVWVVDPKPRFVAAYTPDGVARILREGDEIDGGDVLPGFSLPVAALFAEIDEAE